MKRILSSLLCVALIMSCAILMCADGVEPINESVYVFSDNRRITYLTDSSADIFFAYGIDVQNQVDRIYNYLDLILSYCVPVANKTLNSQLGWTEYQPCGLCEIIKMVDSDADINNVSLSSNSYLYISYNSVDNKEVTLCYNVDGIVEVIIYDRDSDTALVNERGVFYTYGNFRGRL